MTDDPRFDACLPLILKEEGGNDDDPQDHGGRTSRGIIQREYTAWRIKHGLPDRDVWSASDDEIRTIYLDEYWLPRGPKLHPGVDLVWFNFAVNAGPGEAYKLLLRSIGPDNADDDAATVGRMCDAGEAFYRGLGQFARYGKGWTARTARIRAAALKMQKGALVATSAPWPTPKIPTTAPAAPPVTATTPGGHVMLDITQIESEISTGLTIMQNVLPFLSFLGVPPPVIALVSAAVNGAIHLSADVTPSVATALATQHVTPGLPNVPALGAPAS